MKRILSSLFALSLVAVLAGCVAAEPEPTSEPVPTPTIEPTSTPEPTSDSGALSDSDLLRIVEAGYGLVHGEYVYYSVSILNQSEDSAIRFPSFRITARDADGILLATTDQVCTIIYPQQTLVYGFQAFRVDEAPETVDFEIISPDDYNVVKVSKLAQPKYDPLEVINFTRRDTGLVGEVQNNNDYDIDKVVVSVIYRDADGGICGGDLTFIHDLKANSSAPFRISERNDFRSFDYELFAYTCDHQF